MLKLFYILSILNCRTIINIILPRQPAHDMYCCDLGIIINILLYYNTLLRSLDQRGKFRTNSVLNSIQIVHTSSTVYKIVLLQMFRFQFRHSGYHSSCIQRWCRAVLIAATIKYVGGNKFFIFVTLPLYTNYTNNYFVY